MGHVARLFDEWTPLTCSIAPPALPPPHRNRPLSIERELPRVRSKRDTPRSAILQEAAERLYGDYADRVVLYTDGSVMNNGESATVSCAVPALGIERLCRVPHCPSSTMAELAGLHLAADIIAGQSWLTAVVIASDSRTALLQLRYPDRGTPCVAKLSAKLCAVRDRGCDIVLQWLPSHIGLPGNEAADRLAKNANGDSALPESDAVTPFDVARNTIRRRLMARHPDPRVASGNPPRFISFADCVLAVCGLPNAASASEASGMVSVLTAARWKQWTTYYLLDNVEDHCTKGGPQQVDKGKAALKLVISLLDDISSGDFLEDEKVGAVTFLKEQCHLLMKRNNAVRYSAELLVLCSILCNISPHGYKFLRSSGKSVHSRRVTLCLKSSIPSCAHCGWRCARRALRVWLFCVWLVVRIVSRGVQCLVGLCGVVVVRASTL
ncbi:hypothetical protein V5799_024063 [Amblyomma americanum]|uniref:RNase H type-1 domain-containing protein n=1 Tax=Amblyomma americanum TaxID=6943 RepID=A0AAQ4ED36_AMBAM